MRSVAPALAAALLLSCGARRAPPEPVFTGPLAVDLPALSWDESGLAATLRVRNASPFALSIDSLDWSAGPVAVTAWPVEAALAPGAAVELRLRATAPRPPGPAPVVAGTVHTRAPGGIRRAEVFRVAAPASPPEIP